MIFDWLNLTLLSALTAALLFGGMVYFALLFTPLTFRHLSREAAGAFLRQVFPAYYMAGYALAGLAGLLALWPRPLEGAILLIVAFGFGYGGLVLLPKIDGLRALALEGPSREMGGELGGVNPHGERFRLLHRLSMAINLVQLVAVALILVTLMLAA